MLRAPVSTCGDTSRVRGCCVCSHFGAMKAHRGSPSAFQAVARPLYAGAFRRLPDTTRPSLAELAEGPYFVLAPLLDASALCAADATCRLLLALNRAHIGPWRALGLGRGKGLLHHTTQSTWSNTTVRPHHRLTISYTTPPNFHIYKHTHTQCNTSVEHTLSTSLQGLSHWVHLRACTSLDEYATAGSRGHRMDPCEGGNGFEIAIPKTCVWNDARNQANGKSQPDAALTSLLPCARRQLCWCLVTVRS